MRPDRFIHISKIPVAALLLVSLLWSFGSAKAEIAIGILTPLSGKTQTLGKQLELGARLAVDKHQSKPAATSIRLEVLDSACDEATAAKAARKLLQLNVKIVIGPLCSKAMYAALEVLSPNGIPVVAPYIRASRLDRGRKEEGWLSYTLATTANSETENISKILLKRWQGMAYAIADDGSVYGRGLADAFRTFAELNGQKPVALATFRPLQSNQISMLRRLEKSGIEALFVGGDAGDIAQIARDAKKLKLDLEIAGGETLIMLPYVDDAASVPDGILAIMPLDPTLFPRAAGLVANLHKEGIEAEGALIPGYALIEIAANAIANNLLKLEGQSFDTIMGSISFGDNGRAGAYPYQLHVWKDQKVKPLGGL
jgi:branched-chain amino acid transport system substrate-binding protein